MPNVGASLTVLFEWPDRSKTLGRVHWYSPGGFWCLGGRGSGVWGGRGSGVWGEGVLVLVERGLVPGGKGFWFWCLGGRGSGSGVWGEGALVLVSGGKGVWCLGGGGGG